MHIWQTTIRWIFAAMGIWTFVCALSLYTLQLKVDQRWRTTEGSSLQSTATAVARYVAVSGIRPTGNSKDSWKILESESNVEVDPILISNHDASAKDIAPQESQSSLSVALTARPVTWSNEPENRSLLRTEVPFHPPLGNIQGLKFSRVVQYEGTGIPFVWKIGISLWLFGILAGISVLTLPARRLFQLIECLTQWSRALESAKEDSPKRTINWKKIPPMIVDTIPSFPSAIRKIDEGWEQSESSSQRTANTLNGMREGVLTIDPNARVVFANAAACRMLEITNKGFIGKPLVEVVRQPRVSSLLQQAIADDTSSGMQVREEELEIGSVQRTFLRLRASKLPASYGSGAILTLSDETQLRRLENMRRDFTANVSHELKTPLAAIKAYAETLLMGAIDDEVHCRRFIERISEQSNRLESLIQDLLKLARIQAAPNLAADRLDLHTLVQQTIDSYSAVAHGKGIEIRWNHSTYSPIIIADREAVTTILNNLVGNAVRYTEPSGEVLISASVAEEKLTISVRDTGVGIAKEDHERIFERFYRVDKARTIDAGGTGLGLSIVKNLVVAMQGEIRLESELGKGSHFQVLLPVKLGDRETGNPSQPVG